MFKDVELSADIMRAYSATSSGSKARDGDASFDLSVSVLSQGNWPSYPPFPIALPADLTSALEHFKAFYISKHSGRTLAWAHGLDTCSLKANFPTKGKGGGKKELVVSLAQAVILLLFNEVGDAKLGVEEIGEATKLGTFSTLLRARSRLTSEALSIFVAYIFAKCADKKELSRTLQSLACGKVRVLVKHPKGKDINPGDQFSFNSVGSRSRACGEVAYDCMPVADPRGCAHFAGFPRRSRPDQDQPNPAERNCTSRLLQN